MADLKQHFTRLKWLSTMYSEEIEKMKEENHLDNDFELALKLTASETAQNEAIKSFKE